MTTQGQVSPSTSTSAAAPKTAATNPDYSDVCEVPKTEIGDNVIVNRPDSGETSTFTMQPGTDYLMAFDKSAVESMTEENGDLTIAFDCGGTLILKNYTASVGAADPSKLSFLETVNGNELASMITTVQPKEAAVEPAAGEAAPQSAEETAAQAPKEEAPQVEQPSAADLAKAEPAGGDDAAEKLANIEPAAGEATNAAGTERDGYGFNSNFDPTPVNPLQAIGALGATALAYNANFREVFGAPPESNPLPGTPTNDIPEIINIVGNNQVVDETNLTAGQQAINGQVIATFGNDGPGTITFNGDISFTGAAGGQLTSAGLPVTVAFDAQTNSFTGVDSNGATVFTLVMNPATGAYTFTLLGPLDHADPNNPNDQIRFTFSVTATDADGDTASTTISIGVADDGPALITTDSKLDETTDIGGSIEGQLNIDFGSDGPGSIDSNGGFNSQTLDEQGIELTSGGSPVTVSATANGYVGVDANGNTVFTLTIGDDGSYKFELMRPLDHLDPNDPDDSIDLNFGFTVTDYDGDSVQTTITINVADDGPSVKNDDRKVDETTDIGGSVEGQMSVDFGSDGPGSIDANGGFNSQTLDEQGIELTSGGSPVTVSATANGYVGVDANGNTVFTLTIGDDGSYKFELMGPLDHLDPNDPDDSIDLNFGFTVTDADGDSVQTTITINVADDGPSIESSNNNVDETTDIGGSVEGQLNIDFGSDGPGSIDSNGGFNSQTLDEQGIELTSGGSPVTVSATANGYVGVDANGNTVFTLTIGDDGSYKFELKAPIDHPDGTNPNDSIDLNFGFTVTDADGDSVQTTITINVADDGPKAGNDGAEITDPDVPATGNVLDNDDFGADGPGEVTSVEFNGTYHEFPANGDPLVINGQYGVLTISQNGSYTYQAFDGADGLDAFFYEMKDADGDTSRAKLIFTVNTNDDCPVIIQPAKETVDETNLAHGPDVETGTLQVDFGNDGPGTIEGNGAFDFSGSAANNQLTSNGVPVVITLTPEGGYVGTAGGETIFTLTIDSATGNYTFTLLGNLDHADVNDPNDTIILEFGVTATDADGDDASTTITISVDDDAPVICGSCSFIDESDMDCGSVSVHGTVPHNFGEDGPGSITGTGQFSSTGSIGGCALSSCGIPVVVTQLANGSYVGMAGQTLVFTLAINSTSGAYDFTLHETLDHADPNNPNDVINLHFGVAITDDDGDTATSTITIKVADDAPQAFDDNNCFTFEDGTNGNVLTGLNGGPGAADDLSNDHTHVTQIGFGGVMHDIPEGGSVTVEGEYGFLSIDSDGEYTYTPKDIPLTQTVYNFEVNNPPGSDGGGDIKHVETSLNEQTGEFTFSMTIDPSSDGFTLAINGGPNPVGHGGEMALFYFDATDPNNPVINVYAYNGQNTQTSWFDGSSQNGVQAPDAILNSIANPELFSHISVTTDSHGNRVMTFNMDASVIQQHDPIYGPQGQWSGLDFGQQIGMWLHPVSGLETGYNPDGTLCGWNACGQGWYDTSNQCTTETTTTINPLDEFTYTITDCDGDSSTATLTLDGDGNCCPQRVETSQNQGESSDSQTHTLFAVSDAVADRRMLTASAEGASAGGLMASVLLASALVDAKLQTRDASAAETQDANAVVADQATALDTDADFAATLAKGQFALETVKAEVSGDDAVLSSKAAFKLFEADDALLGKPVLAFSDKDISVKDRFDEVKDVQQNSKTEDLPVALQEAGDNVVSEQVSAKDETADLLFADVLQGDEFGVLKSLEALDAKQTMSNETVPSISWLDIVDTSAGFDGKLQNVIDDYVMETTKTAPVETAVHVVSSISVFDIAGVVEFDDELLRVQQAIAA